METLRLRARWGPRKETVDECAEKLTAFLGNLAECDETFANGWLKCATSIESEPERIRVSAEAFRNLLGEGRVRRDEDQSVMEALGFRSGRLWNGREDAPAYVYVECGAYPNPRTMPGANCVWVEVPNQGQKAMRILSPEQLSKIIRVVVKNWDPDWARISTNKIEAEIYQENPYLGQMVGWFTYVSDRYGELPELGAEFEVTRVGDLGNLIFIHSIERPTISNPMHVSTMRQLSETLDQAGMLAPTPMQRF